MENDPTPIPEMVERVAIALHSNNNHADDTAWSRRAWLDLKEENKNDYRRIARAVIETMREPTEAMCQAAGDTFEPHACADCFKIQYDAAIGVALGE